MNAIDLAVAPLVTRRLEPRRGWQWPSVGDAWAARELLLFLVWREVKVRYNQTALGAAWALIQPLMTMVVFTVFFGRLARIPSDGLPYPVFSLCAVVPWTYFATALTNGAQSLVGQQRLIVKVYFPRLLVPLAAVMSPLVDFSIAFAILLALVAAYRVPIHAAVAFVPVFLLMAAVTATAAAVWLSALSVRYRDIRYVLPFAVQLWMFVTPVAYPASLVPPRWRALYGLNPMVGVVEGFRWALVGGPWPGVMMFASLVGVSVVLALGLSYFRHVEGTFADLL